MLVNKINRHVNMGKQDLIFICAVRCKCWDMKLGNFGNLCAGKKEMGGFEKRLMIWFPGLGSGPTKLFVYFIGAEDGNADNADGNG
jgi:hypothetical protein